MRELVRTTVRTLRGVYVWAVLGVLGMFALLVVLFVPRVEQRRAIARAAARGWMRLSGMPLTVLHEDRLPAGQCVVVANHASYLDGVVMTAALPPRFGFVIKREMSSVPFAGLMLRRLGSQFVERFNQHRGASDARRVLRTASDGHSLAFFPEGTFSHEPGLLKFHTGAFVTAARAGCPVVPCVIRGTRAALPSSRILPTPVPIEVEILPPIARQAQEQERASLLLRDAARAAIIASLEPESRAAATACPS